VVIDVLRATSTLCHAFAAGAAEARFFATPETTRAAQRELAGAETLLCGEREGIKIPGFDLGNSPLEYRPEIVGGRTLLFASTNGSLAFLATSKAEVQWAVGFVNLAAAVERAQQWLAGAAAAGAGELPCIEVVCSGKLGRPAAEDSACAALFVERLEAALGEEEWQLEVEAPGLPPAPADPASTLALVGECEHGRYLRSLGPEYEADLGICAAWDSLTVVPTGRGSLIRHPELP
jgi:2-phosphosulfolactate phosphatase